MYRLIEIGDKVLPYELEIDDGVWPSVSAIIEVPFKYLFKDAPEWVSIEDIPDETTRTILATQIQDYGYSKQEALEDFVIDRSMYIDTELEYRNISRPDDKDTYELSFYAYFSIASKDSGPDRLSFVSEPMSDATGLGGAPIIFSTILKFVKDAFDNIDDIGTVIFAADKSPGESRARLYKMLANKYAPEDALVITADAATEHALHLAMQKIDMENVGPETAHHLNSLLSEVPRIYDGDPQTAISAIVLPVGEWED